MAAEPRCPHASSLQALVEGTLADEQQVELAGHLEDCADCRRRFEELAAASGVPSDAGRGHDDPWDGPDSSLHGVIEELVAKGPHEAGGAAQSGGDEISLDFLRPSDNPDHLGRLGSYEITDVIGQGGMAVVLKGHDPQLRRSVAIKVLSPQLAANGTARKRFLREARAAAAVSHNHVVTIHAVEEVDGLPFLVMEYIAGFPLEERIRRTGPLEPEEILRIGMQAADGLAAAHAQGLVHRDIKPANILLENHVERVKITDFGLARAVDDVHFTRDGYVAGTPEYMSPEQARGEPVDHRGDLFSLGCVLYAMCAGRPPFRARTTLEAIRRVCEDTPRPLEQVNPAIPGWMAEIVDTLLAKDPDDRFQSASEVAELLGQHLAHLQQGSLAPKPPGSVKAVAKTRREAVRPTRRRRWFILVLLVLLVLAGLVLTEATGVTRLAARFTRPPPLETTPRVDLGRLAGQPHPSRFEPVDLLAIVDPARDSSLEGEWQLREGMLISPPKGKAWLQIPYVPPDQYDLTLAVERITGVQSVRLGLVLGGRQCFAKIDAWPAAGTTVTCLADLSEENHSQVRQSPVIPPGKLVDLVCEVRKVANDHAVRVTCDGEELLEWAGRAGQLPQAGDWVPTEGSILFLGSHDSVFHVTKLEITPISAKGRHSFTDRESATADRVAAERALWKGAKVWVATDEGPPVEIERIDELPPSFEVAQIDARMKKRFSDADLECLVGLDRLEQLDLGGTSIGDGLSQCLAELPNLERLDLRLTQITDASVEPMAGCKGLRSLVLGGTQMTDEGLKHLAELGQLEELDLRGTRISDAGLAALKNLTRLKRLLLDHTAVADAGIVPLCDIRSLTELSLLDTQVTKAGIEGLRGALPKCQLQVGIEHPINLLELIDPGSVEGHGAFRDEAIVLSEKRNVPLQIPFSPPDEYALEAVAERVSGSKSLMFGIVAGDRQPAVCVDSYQGGVLTTLDAIDGKTGMYNETAFPTTVFEVGKPVRVAITVRASRITAMCGDRLLIDWSGDFGRLSPYPSYTIPDEDQLYVHTFQSVFKIHKMHLTPISRVGPAAGREGQAKGQAASEKDNQEPTSVPRS